MELLSYLDVMLNQYEISILANELPKFRNPEIPKDYIYCPN
jgi:hypothetical protein